MSAVLSTIPAPALRVDAAAGPGEQEFSFGHADFERVRQLIYQRAGISLHAGKQAMVYSRLSRRLRETGHRSFASYLQWLEQPSGTAGALEWQEFVNCLTTNLTSFFREEHHFHELAKDLQSSGTRPLRIWCNAASTGEEPYSIAMTVAESPAKGGGVRIVASDIDTKVLGVASRGVYPADQPDGSALAARRSVRRGVLPQRDDLFRFADAAPRARAHPWGDEAARPALRRPLGEFLRGEGSVPPARQDDLRARVSSVSFSPATVLQGPVGDTDK